MERKPTASDESRTQDRKRKWKPFSNSKYSETCSLSQLSQPEEDLIPGNKYLKVGTKSQSSRSQKEFCTPAILKLPNELLEQIILHLGAKDIGRLAATCHRFNNVISQSHVWRCLCRRHFPFWNGKKRPGMTSSNLPLYGTSWKRQYSINYTKGIKYQLLGAGSSKRRTQSSITDIKSAYGFKKLCCSRDHVFALDLSSYLHVYRWERQPITNDYVYRRVDWHHDFAEHVIDVTTDPRYDNNHRRYVYVLTQSEAMRSRRFQPNTRSTTSSHNGWDSNGNLVAGDKIDVFDERTCRRVFNMTFDPEMRFTSMKLTSVTPQQKTLFILTDAGKVYSLHLYESSLLNLGSEGMQVTLKSASKTLGEKVTKIETSVGVVGFLTDSGKFHVVLQRKSEFADIFGRDAPVKLTVPQHIPHIAKIMRCSIGDRHLGFIDEYNRAFMVGNNRYGQLGTGDRMDRCSPVQVLYNKRIRILHCSLNHTLAVIESGDDCAMLGAGCGNNGRLPGNSRGSVEFVKLDVKLPWSIKQIDVHKECVFLLLCRDIDDQITYKRQPKSDHVTESMALKSQQELLIDMRKTPGMVDKIGVLEAMVDKTNRKNMLRQEVNSPLKSADQRSKVNSDSVNQEHEVECNLSEDLRFIKLALEQLRLAAERVELDKHILSGQNLAQ